MSILRFFFRLPQFLTILFWGSLSSLGFSQQIDEHRLNESPRYPQEVPQSIPNPLKVGAASCNRTAVVADYISNYLGSALNLTELGWTGSVTGCSSGSISALAQTRTLQRINYYRRLVGLPDNMLFDPSRNTQTQDAALMMKANNNLSHSPPTSWTCYTAAGAAGAGSSNLVLGAYGSNAIKVYMDDPGLGNELVGHRRWILYSQVSSFGHGSTDYSDALWVFNSFVTPASVPAFVAFPAQGYMPRTLIPPRWSFSIPSADFSSCTVTMQDEANLPIALTQYPITNGYGDNTVVWNISAPATVLAWSGVTDKAFKVNISGVKIGGITQPTYTYTVVAIDPSLPVFTVTGINPTCGTPLANGTATVIFDRGAKSIQWSNGATTPTVTGLASGTYTVTVTDKNDCTYSQTITLSNTISNVPILSASSTTLCGGENTLLTAGNCTGIVTWSNGLGIGNTKTVAPAVTTTYSATCSENACPGSSNTITINVTPGPAPACIASVTNGISPYFGVESFQFNTINVLSASSSGDGVNYINRSCTDQTTVTAGNSYSMSVKGVYTNTHYIKVYIDFNSNGNLTDAAELVLSGTGNTVSGLVTIPSSATRSTPLRIRVLADPSGSSNPCQIVGDPLYGSGQIEDFSLLVTPDPVCAAMYTVKAGNWNDPTVWSCNRVPVATDAVEIRHIISIPASYIAHALAITYSSGQKLSLGSNARLLLNQ